MRPQACPACPPRARHSRAHGSVPLPRGPRRPHRSPEPSRRCPHARAQPCRLASGEVPLPVDTHRPHIIPLHQERHRKREQTGKMSSLQTLLSASWSQPQRASSNRTGAKSEKPYSRSTSSGWRMRTARTAFIIFDESLSLITLAAALWVPRTARCLALRSRKCAPGTTPCPP